MNITGYNKVNVVRILAVFLRENDLYFYLTKNEDEA
jgi:hypothetical protein